MNTITITNIKVWPLDINGQPIITERPSYHCFSIDSGQWTICRKDGCWSACFRRDDA